MSDKDVAVPVAYRIPDGSPITTKPCHLVVMKDGSMFLSLERPVMEPAFIQGKGFWLKESKEVEVVNKWKEILRHMSENKKNVVEEYIAWSEICHIQNLAYQAK